MSHEVVLYEGQRVRLTWGEVMHLCTVHRSTARCGMCGGPTVRLDQPWNEWSLLCLKESALTTTRERLVACQLSLSSRAVGIVAAVPVRVSLDEITE